LCWQRRINLVWRFFELPASSVVALYSLFFKTLFSRKAESQRQRAFKFPEDMKEGICLFMAVSPDMTANILHIIYTYWSHFTHLSRKIGALFCYLHCIPRTTTEYRMARFISSTPLSIYGAVIFTFFTVRSSFPCVSWDSSVEKISTLFSDFRCTVLYNFLANLLENDLLQFSQAFV